MTRDCTELRESIAESRIGQKRWRCPVGLRDEIVGFAQDRRREGVSVRKVARELGVSETGLNRWLQKAEGGLRPIRVVETPSGCDALVLVTPGGYRLEGLSTSSAAEVLRSLGC